MNSTMQSMLEIVGDKNKGGRKFKRHVRDEQKKSVPTKSPRCNGRRKRSEEEKMGADGVEVHDAKKAKQVGGEAEGNASETNVAGLSEQPCEAQ